MLRIEGFNASHVLELRLLERERLRHGTPPV
jgi:hypothetical protein